jgi:type III secretion protein J
MRLLPLGVLAIMLYGCSVPVAAALDEPDANRVVVALDQAGIDASKEADPTSEGKFRVSVARDDVGRALATMRDEELPKPRARSLVDAADRGQLVPSQAAEHAQLVSGLAGELERTLGAIEGVLAARVHLNVPAREPFRDGPTPRSTASVLIEHRGSTPPIAPESIQRLVAGGAPGVLPADVAVVFVPRPARGSGRTDLAHVGPITVARGSTLTLKIALAGLVALVLSLAAATLALWAKVARLRREQDELHSSARATPPLSRAPMHVSHPPHMSARPPHA